MDQQHQHLVGTCHNGRLSSVTPDLLSPGNLNACSKVRGTELAQSILHLGLHMLSAKVKVDLGEPGQVRETLTFCFTQGRLNIPASLGEFLCKPCALAILLV